MRLNSAEFYADLARIVRRGETIDIDPLLEHLRTIGYNSADAVDMPGEFALRGGILDVYPPEADRPLRIEFFGDEVETIRKFDPSTQRSAAPVDEVVLLPLAETPVNDHVLGVIHSRLSGQRLDVASVAPRTGRRRLPSRRAVAPGLRADRTRRGRPIPERRIGDRHRRAARCARRRWRRGAHRTRLGCSHRDRRGGLRA